MMSAFEKLKEKIEDLVKVQKELKKENVQLKKELEGASPAKKTKGKDNSKEIEALKKELKEKDDEIEKIIAQVESLLT
jgi:predicted RNase H-like nuclease (RuvC/YqgF family)